MIHTLTLEFAKICSEWMMAAEGAWREQYEKKEHGIPQPDLHVRDSARHCHLVGTETIPNQGSRALIIQQTYRGSFAAVVKPIFASQCSFCRIF